jgi:hypothetical protein
MPHIDIRRATIGDLPVIMLMIAQMDLDGGKQLALPEAKEIFTRVSTYANYEVYVATVDTEVIATFVLLIMYPLSHHGARSVIIEDVTVSDANAPTHSMKILGSRSTGIVSCSRTQIAPLGRCHAHEAIDANAQRFGH